MRHSIFLEFKQKSMNLRRKNYTDMQSRVLLTVLASLWLAPVCSDHALYEPRSRVSKPQSKHIHVLTPYNFNMVEDTFRMSRAASGEQDEQISLKNGWLIAFQSHLCKHCNRV